MSKKIARYDNESPLEKHVRLWLNEKGQDYGDGWMGAWRDLEYGGCSSGMVSNLIYYSDTLKFYKKYKKEIHGLLREAFENHGVSDPSAIFGDKWDKEDPFAEDTQNQNLLAWFGFEETAYLIAHRESNREEAA